MLEFSSFQEGPKTCFCSHSKSLVLLDLQEIELAHGSNSLISVLETLNSLVLKVIIP